MGFSKEIREKALVACKRHCVWCEAYKGNKIECHHILKVADGGDDSFDNCIPLCFDCHADIGAYNPKHPKGNKCTISELKTRRDNFYNRVQNGEFPKRNSDNVRKFSLLDVFKSDRNITVDQSESQAKREVLHDIYTDLIEIVKLYPNQSPNNILELIDCGTHYSMEHFESNLKSLDYQIEHYKNLLSSNHDLNCTQKWEFEEAISNREYAKKVILEIEDGYFKAKERYDVFVQTSKSIFDLYAGQEVRNCLVKFEVVINNVFIAGYHPGAAEDPLNNIIIMARENLIQSMRNDIGIG